MEELTETNIAPGNSIDPLMGTCLGRMDRAAVRDMIMHARVNLAYQQGGTFFFMHGDNEKSNTAMAIYEYPFRSRGNPDVDTEEHGAAMHEAAAMFLRDNPEYSLISLESGKW